MAADDFFMRWAKKKECLSHEVIQDPLPSTPLPLPLPTLDDVAALTGSSDFSRFVGQGVDEVVKRLALKKLFSDPHFNIMDGLDTYIEDYNTFVPMTADMVAELNHAKLLMNPLAHLEQPFMQMLEVPLPNAVADDDLLVDAIDEVAALPEAVDCEIAAGPDPIISSAPGATNIEVPSELSASPDLLPPTPTPSL